LLPAPKLRIENLEADPALKFIGHPDHLTEDGAFAIRPTRRDLTSL